MAKLSVALAVILASSAAAFSPAPSGATSTKLSAALFDEPNAEVWDPLGLAVLGTGEAFDTFPNMFPHKQYLAESEAKHGRMAMLGWTGVWATHQGGLGLGLHFPGFPEEPDWTKALGVFAAEQPAWFGAILAFIAVAEGEGVSHTGDNWKGNSSKVPGNMGFDYLGLKKKLSKEDQDKYRIWEIKNGRAAMIGMLSLFTWKALPGSVPIMDILDPQF